MTEFNCRPQKKSSRKSGITIGGEAIFYSSPEISLKSAKLCKCKKVSKLQASPPTPWLRYSVKLNLKSQIGR